MSWELIGTFTQEIRDSWFTILLVAAKGILLGWIFWMAWTEAPEETGG